ncbi:hypothetical protein IL306_009655 [Fusarium sp. DS 682]|nr:hypothetical protein IL306_009655 [Fusarium sp. DS 682]
MDPESSCYIDKESTFDKTGGQANDNPYYTPRKRSFPEFAYCNSSTRSEKSPKKDHEHEQYSPVQLDKSVWKNAFDPIPTVEEASTADDSHESASDIIEYKLIVEAASSVEEEENEVSSGQDSNESDEIIESDSSHNILPIRPLTGSIAV